jgi:hypothetical protein
MEVVPPAIRDCAFDRVAGLNPKPPSAVATRGLPPATRSKQGREIELGMEVSATFSSQGDNVRGNDIFSMIGSGGFDHDMVAY